jgi:hypothetical protein
LLHKSYAYKKTTTSNKTGVIAGAAVGGIVGLGIDYVIIITHSLVAIITIAILVAKLRRKTDENNGVEMGKYSNVPLVRGTNSVSNQSISFPSMASATQLKLRSSTRSISFFLNVRLYISPISESSR